MVRRLLVVCLIGLASAMSAPSAAAKESDVDGTLRFEVELGGRPIGEHALAFRRQPDDALAVDIQIDLEVTFGPFTIYEYRHRNETLWRAGRLARLQSRTDDDGDTFNLSAVADAQGLAVQSEVTGTYTAAPETLPTTYWMVSTVAQDRLLNSQTGELIDVDITRVGRETVAGPEGPIAATRYRVEGDLEVDLWYDNRDTLVQLSFQARGSEVSYRLVERWGVNSLPSWQFAMDSGN